MELLGLMAQASATDPKLWIGMFFASGMVAMIIVAIANQVVMSRERRRIKKEAEAAGVQVALEYSTTWGLGDVDVEDCGCCIMLIVAMALGALGISLPIVLSEAAEDLIMLTVLVVFGAVTWATTIWAPIYVRKEKRRFRRILDEALGRRDA